MLDVSRLPTPLASVARRMNVTGAAASGDTFLIASYFTEALLKTLALALLAAIRRSAPSVAYAVEYELVRADGIGSWDAAIASCTGSTNAGYVDSDLQQLVVWLTKRRTQPEDAWVRDAAAAATDILVRVGAVDATLPAKVNVRFLLGQLVQIRNKTRGHGAVGPEFFAHANPGYIRIIQGLLQDLPMTGWEWYFLSPQSQGRTSRAVRLLGAAPSALPEDDAELRAAVAGIHFRTHSKGHLFYVGDLLRTGPECLGFAVPNGGFTSGGNAEFIDYANGRVELVPLPQYVKPPPPLPPSRTEGLAALDIFSNVFGNLPTRPERYVSRPTLETELLSKLRDRNHPIITLHGRGGIGKTSLAVHAAHELAEPDPPLFEHILWLSARDLELKPSGATEVRRHVSGLDTMCKLVGSLLGVSPTFETLARVLQDPATAQSRGLLLVCDNFESLDDPTEIHRFLDTHTHLPNKVLITSRERAFKGDYPIEVGGMEPEEARRLLAQESLELGIDAIVDEAAIEEIFQYTDGHAYVMRVLLGEIAKEGRWIPLRSLVPRRSDLLSVVFERSFNRLSPEAKWAFLCIANWKSAISELALLVVLGNRGLDAEKGIEECVRLSLVTRGELADQSYCYSAPELARLFAKKKLDGDPDRLLLLEDFQLLRDFGPLASATSLSISGDTMVSQFVDRCLSRSSILESAESDKTDSILQSVAELWPVGWAGLARFRQMNSAPPSKVEYALRRAVEERPFDKAAWLARAEFADAQGDHSTRIACLVSAVEADPKDVSLVREVAYQLCQYVDAHKFEIPIARRGVYLASLRTHMERVATSLDATGLSRLAWLFLLENNQAGAWKYANDGLSRDSTNSHCLRIVERLDAQGFRPNS